ncbi:MAG: hypothetical protein C0474_02665 [Sphingobium sp.]|nr:hypothetical protein [Sphingobium sp.]
MPDWVAIMLILGPLVVDETAMRERGQACFDLGQARLLARDTLTPAKTGSTRLQLQTLCIIL